MSKVRQSKNQVIQRLKQEIGRLSDQQTAAQTMAARVGMTPDDSVQYKDATIGLRG
jgi:hypothetical protein